MKINIKTKLNIGDILYEVNSGNENTRIKCPKCNGENIKIIDGTEYHCDNCFRDGTVNIKIKKYYISTGKIKSIMIKINEKGELSIWYEWFFDDCWINELNIGRKEVFVSEEEAKEYIKQKEAGKQ